MSLSFRIERPSGQSSRSGQASGSNGRYGGPGGRGERTLAGEYAADSSEDEAEEDRRRNHRELITDFDASRPVEKPQELSIPALPDKDFRAIHLAKKRKKEMYRPEGGAVGVMRQSTGGTGAKVDESAEGVDQMNAKPMEGGLRLGDGGRRVKKEEDVEEGTLGVPSALDGVPGTGASTPIGQLSLLSGAPSPAASGSAAPPVPKKEEETEDQKALRELLAGEGKEEEAQIDMIPMASTKKEEDGDADDYDSDSDGPQDETSVFRRDVASRPDVPTLEDYARVPVGQFGAALLRGMGWQEGQAASRNGRQGPAEAYVPKARPSLLGIGAKPMKVDEEDAKKGAKRPERRYVPLVRKVTDRATPRDSGADDSDFSPSPGSRSRSRSPPSRRSSRSPPRSSSRRDHRSDRDRDRDRDHRRYDSDREGGYGSSSSRRYDSDRDRDRDRDRRREKEDRHHDKERYERKDRDRERDRYEARGTPAKRDRSRDRDSGRRAY